MTSSLPPAPPDPVAPQPGAAKDVEYKGAPLDAAKGPGLGCFWIQVIVLAVVVVLTPLSAAWEWPVPVTIFLLALTLVLLLFVGQTIIFLLRIVAADRRASGRRVPLRSETKTVGEIEDESPADELPGDRPPGDEPPGAPGEIEGDPPGAPGRIEGDPPGVRE